MTWVKLDDQFSDHPKIAELGELAPPAGWLHVCALCYCARYLTDGHIPSGQIPRLAAVDSEPLVKALLEVGLWEEEERGYVIHDYLDFNPSREQVLAERAAKKAGGRRGGKASAQARAQAAAEADAQAYPQASPQADAQAYAGGGACPQLAEPPQAESNSRTRTPTRTQEDQDLPPKEAAASSRAREERSSLEEENPGDTLPPYLTDEPDPTDSLLVDLWAVPGWKRSPKQDREDLGMLGRAFPRADLATAIQQLRAKAADGAVKTNPRSALQAFVKQLHLSTPAPRTFDDEAPPGKPTAAELKEQAKAAAAVAAKFRPGVRA